MSYNSYELVIELGGQLLTVSELYCDLSANVNDVYDVLKDLVATTLL